MATKKKATKRKAAKRKTVRKKASKRKAAPKKTPTEGQRLYPDGHAKAGQAMPGPGKMFADKTLFNVPIERSTLAEQKEIARTRGASLAAVYRQLGERWASGEIKL